MDFKKYIPRYKQLCKKYWNLDVSEEVGLDGVVRLFNLAKAISEPIPKEDYEKSLKDERSSQ